MSRLANGNRLVHCLFLTCSSEMLIGCITSLCGYVVMQLISYMILAA